MSEQKLPLAKAMLKGSRDLRLPIPSVTRNRIGAALLTYGAGLAYWPAGLMVAGALLLIGAYLDAREKKK